jgi:hypothetical protein
MSVYQRWLDSLIDYYGETLTDLDREAIWREYLEKFPGHALEIIQDGLTLAEVKLLAEDPAEFADQVAARAFRHVEETLNDRREER